MKCKTLMLLYAWGMVSLFSYITVLYMTSDLLHICFIFVFFVNSLLSYFFCNHLGKRIQSEHYLLEDINSTPQRHRSQIRLKGAGDDRETGFTWCSFIRNIEPQDTYDLDLRRNYYQVYLWGEWNVSTLRYKIKYTCEIIYLTHLSKEK